MFEEVYPDLWFPEGLEPDPVPVPESVFSIGGAFYKAAVVDGAIALVKVPKNFKPSPGQGNLFEPNHWLPPAPKVGDTKTVLGKVYRLNENKRWVRVKNAPESSTVAGLNVIDDGADLPELETLFNDADRVGGKYQTDEERQAFQDAMNTEVEEIGRLTDEQFPDEEMEVIDYSGRMPSGTLQPRRSPAPAPTVRIPGAAGRLLTPKPKLESIDGGNTGSPAGTGAKTFEVIDQLQARSRAKMTDAKERKAGIKWGSSPIEKPEVAAAREQLQSVADQVEALYQVEPDLSDDELEQFQSAVWGSQAELAKVRTTYERLDAPIPQELEDAEGTLDLLGKRIRKRNISPVTSMFDARLARGDAEGAIDQAILEADQDLWNAKKTKLKLRSAQQQIDEKAQEIRDKYQPLPDEPEAVPVEVVGAEVVQPRSGGTKRRWQEKIDQLKENQRKDINLSARIAGAALDAVSNLADARGVELDPIELESSESVQIPQYKGGLKARIQGRLQDLKTLNELNDQNAASMLAVGAMANEMTRQEVESMETGAPALKPRSAARALPAGSVAAPPRKDDVTTKLVDVSAVQATPVARSPEVEQLAQDLVASKGATSAPVILVKDGPESFRVADDPENHKLAAAAAKAKEMDPRGNEMMNALIANSEAEARDMLSQRARIGFTAQDAIAVPGKMRLVDVSAVSAPAGDADPDLAESRLRMGNTAPIVLRETSPNQYEVVSGHDVFAAMQAAKKQNPRRAEMFNAFVME